jgi:hypothetical protein
MKVIVATVVVLLLCLSVVAAAATATDDIYDAGWCTRNAAEAWTPSYATYRYRVRCNRYRLHHV